MNPPAPPVPAPDPARTRTRCAPAGPPAKPAHPLRDLVPSMLWTPFGDALLQIAEKTYQDATRDQLEQAVKRLVELDRARALAVAALLSWYTARGDKVELPHPPKELLPWIFLANREQMQALADQVVRHSVQGAGMLLTALDRALQARQEEIVGRKAS